MRDRDLAVLAAYCAFAGTVLGFAIAQMLKMPTLCNAADTSCVRGWLAALSGWAAGAAALLTVWVLSKQLRESRLQHIEFMKFQAYERLLLVEQVGNNANMALGTITQIFHEFHDEESAPSSAKLTNYVAGARFVLSNFLDKDFEVKRSQAQASLPPVQARAEVTLPEFVKLSELVLAAEDGELTEVQRQSALRVASGQLMLAHEDLKALSRELREFKKNWAHLAT